ncbi:hypothetical protein JR316_0010362 [Psilocybe cubensis]|uniref:Uncharacterized protein n=4 Tax=Psilocybe cubensis TaxID=181762 RepID=A0ACB8GGA8_PSICU|nr:uncharacterized protein JR316_0013486 [Psilocybe cubensis]XP_047741842.1 uncharacterized protein JR316_0013490 [Psilocybe cubensis]XP_047741846.1 uncharacterized protein JR316_0013494 [Psilocybe cubensis]XP_047744075.1 hypothetical protein JR316_0010362 [Psilocybe cubensis]KAH9474213.1 hypothetical protein JR316_0013486 [Psilocybe cubensis]KAH9474217.1 hypothetical protein JR316_0013490 [Psilocybe cubensis]KAH9474221.1 hypothetical protein JR316_0013494 [Psilocybe cubensis]KAH9476450.1 hy
MLRVKASLSVAGVDFQVDSTLLWGGQSRVVPDEQNTEQLTFSTPVRRWQRLVAVANSYVSTHIHVEQRITYLQVSYKTYTRIPRRLDG